MHERNLLVTGALAICICLLVCDVAHAQGARRMAHTIETLRKSEIVIDSASALKRAYDESRFREAFGAAPEVKLTKEDLNFARLSKGLPEADAHQSSSPDDSKRWKFSFLTGKLKVGTFKSFEHGEVEGGEINLYKTGGAVGGVTYCLAETGSPLACAKSAWDAIAASTLKWTCPHDENAKPQAHEPLHPH
jgi:hypothetical protein